MITKQTLSKGWRWGKLEDIGSFESGGTPSKGNPEYWGGDVPFVTGADVTDLYITRNHARTFITEKGLKSGKTTICYPGTVLFVTRTGVGKVGIASEIMGASQDLSPYVCNETVDPEYICRYLQSIKSHLIDNSRGAIIRIISINRGMSSKLSSTSLNEDKRVN